MDETGWKGLFKEFGIEITGKTTMNSLITEYFHRDIRSELENTIWFYSSTKRRLSWSDLDTGRTEDLGRLLVDLIGSERIPGSRLGQEIGKFQARNSLSQSGSKGLFAEFGISITPTKSMKSAISGKFSHLIRVEQDSPTVCYYSLVNGKA